MGITILSLILCTIALLMDIMAVINNATEKNWGRMVVDIFFTICMVICICFNVVRINTTFNNAAHEDNGIEMSANDGQN